MSETEVPRAPYRHRELRADWRRRFRQKRDDLGEQQDIITWFREFARGPGDDDILEQMQEELASNTERVLRIIQSDCPIGFVRPSWEQAQVLNAWHPDEGGFNSVVNLTCNRGGKTAVAIFDTELWIVPNDPDWIIFEEFEDVEGRKAGCDRGNYRVRQRPDFDIWKRTGRMVYEQDQPPKSQCDIWHGCENEKKWEDPILKEYKKWMPKWAIGKRSDGGSAIYKQERRLETKWGHTITGKTYNSDIQDWAGTEVWRLNMDEGFDPRIFQEAMLRVRGGGYFHWAYTVAEARNTGPRARLAHECYKGKHNLIGKARFFTGFRMSMIPDWIMAPEKKADDMARLAKEGEIGRVRMGEIPFAVSSPVVFANFDRDTNVLPVDGADVLLAIKGTMPQRWITELGETKAGDLYQRLRFANIIRGFDEGLASPSAAVWVALLKGNEMVAFREMEVSGLSVSERCRTVIERSGNKWDLVKLNREEQERSIYREKVMPETGMRVRRTLADSKMFRRDPEKPQDDWTEKYRRAGLQITRANNIGPAQRCDYLNDLLRAEANRMHLIEPSKPGPRFYITRDCQKLIERMENYLWGQILQGPRMGEFTDQPEKKDDHTIDSACYSADNGMRWVDLEALSAPPKVSLDVDPVTGYARV
jgi:hypothetical protein